MAKYTLDRGTHARYEGDGELHRYNAGDEIELDKQQAQRLANRISNGPAPAALTAAGQFDLDAGRATAPVRPRVVPSPPGALTQPSLTQPNLTTGFDLGAVNAAQAREHIRTVQDGPTLHELRRQEVSGKNRDGVLKDIDAQLAEIGDEPPKGDGGGDAVDKKEAKG